MLTKAKASLSKIKILFDIIRTSLRKRRMPVLIAGSLTCCLHSVRFLGADHPIVVQIYCFKREFWRYDGRSYKPSGIYKDWLMYYQDPKAPTAGVKGLVVYPTAHHFKNVIEHYVAYLETTTSGGHT